jgi:hypothetical protein
MKRYRALILTAVLAAAVPAAAAAQSINERQANLDARIDAGVRSGDLSRQEAQRLRGEFDALMRMEAQYRATGGGISDSERRELERQFNDLSMQIRDERRDGDGRGGRDDYGRDRDRNWQDRDDRGRPGAGYDGANLDERERVLLQRIDRGERNGGLTRMEARQLRAELEAIVRIEAQYRASGRGIDRVEREYLDRRFDTLERRLREDRRDDDRRWTRLDERQAQFDQRLDQAVRDRQISPRVAANLRAEFRGIARLERQYRNSPPGITPNERMDLNRRFDQMEANFRASVSPTNNLFDLLFGLSR